MHAGYGSMRRERYNLASLTLDDLR